MEYAFLVSIAVISFSFFVVQVPKARLKYNLVSPLFLVPVFVILYMIVGFNAYWKGDYFFLGTDFSDGLDFIYKVVFVFELSFLVFFAVFYRYFKRSSCLCISSVGSPVPVYFYLYVVVMMFYGFLVILGFRIPVFHNLLMIFFNAAIIVLSYMYICKVRGGVVLVGCMALLIAYMGFRYRLIFLFLPVIFYLFVSVRLLSVKFLGYCLVVFGAIFFVAIVGVARRYSQGLQMEALDNLNLLDILVNGFFNDTSTVFTSGAFIDFVEKTDNYAYFDQIWYVLNYFIPSAIYPEKEYSPIFEYLSLLTGQNGNEAGAAILGFAEYYHTAGYYGVLLFSILFAFFLAKFFRKMVISNSKYQHFFYFALLTWFVNSLTRGYFPQNVQDLLSVLVGLYLIKCFSNPDLGRKC